MNLLGRNGLIRDSVEKGDRDAKTGRIDEGTDDMLLRTVAQPRFAGEAP